MKEYTIYRRPLEFSPMSMASLYENVTPKMFGQRKLNKRKKHDRRR